MGQGTSAPPVDAAAPAAPGTAPAQGSALSDNQVKAIAMLMSNLGKGGQPIQGMGAPQGQSPYPQTSTIQGGTYFSPNQPR